MQTAWLIRHGRERLILFFAGWGMASEPFVHLDCHAADVLMGYDYRDPTLPQACQSALASYRRCDLIAWSMGVAVADRLLRPHRSRLCTATAINGTPRPIDARYGIPPEMFHATLENLSRGGLDRFYRRMCRDRAILRRFLENRPRREPADLIDELKTLGDWAHSPSNEPLPPQENLFDTALIGLDDRIVSAENQRRYWQGFDTVIREIETPHFPFFAWNRWEEIRPDDGN